MSPDLQKQQIREIRTATRTGKMGSERKAIDRALETAMGLIADLKNNNQSSSPSR